MRYGGLDSEKSFADSVGETALRSLLFVAAATPKPGLADCANDGASGIGLFHYISSATALHNKFSRFVEIGFGTDALPPREAVKFLRRAGIEAEERMLEATGGINTHKGTIFALAAICGAIGRRGGCSSPEAVCSVAAELCSGFCSDAFGNLEDRLTRRMPTNGERAYLEHGYRGIRGEAEDGFPTVIKEALPAYDKMKELGASENDALVHALLHIIAKADDTDVIALRGQEALAHAKAEAGRVLASGGMAAEVGRSAAECLDRDFINRGIRPSGCETLLIVTAFLAAMRSLGDIKSEALPEDDETDTAD